MSPIHFDGLQQQIPMDIRAACVMGFTLLVTAASRTEAQGHPFDLERTRSVLSALIERTLKETGVPSISIALVRGDSIVWKAAFGYANVRTKARATTETMYNAASTFKAVTATALMQLAEQGKLQLDHPIDRYLGDLTFRGLTNGNRPITFTLDDVFTMTLRDGRLISTRMGRSRPSFLPRRRHDSSSVAMRRLSSSRMVRIAKWTG